MVRDESMVPPGHRQREDDVNRATGPVELCFEECLPLGVKLPDDLLKTGQSSLDLDQHDGRRAVEPQVDRTTARSWNGGLERRPPAGIADSEQAFLDARLDRITNQRSGTRKCRDAKVRTQQRGDAKAGAKRHPRIALLEPANEGSAGADRRRNRGLRNARPKPERPELVRGPSRLLTKSSITFADRNAVLSSARGRFHVGITAGCPYPNINEGCVPYRTATSDRGRVERLWPTLLILVRQNPGFTVSFAVAAVSGAWIDPDASVARDRNRRDHKPRGEPGSRNPGFVK